MEIAPLKIAHFTDVHVTADPAEIPWRDLVSKRFLGWANLRFFHRHRDFADAPLVLRAFLDDLAAVGPDAIVCTGDLTGLALPGEFAAARQALAPLLDDPRVTGIPGNHDVYVRSAVDLRLYEESFGAWTRTDLAPEDLPPDLRGLYPYPLVRLLGEETVLVALRDVRPNALHDSSGRVGREQMAALDALLAHPRLARPTRILTFHTSLLRADGRRDPWHHRLRDGDELLEIAKRRGVSLLIHGHRHRRFVFPAGQRTPVAMANPGSLTSAHGDRAYHIYVTEAGGRGIAVEARRYDAGTGRFVPWPEASGVRIERRVERPT